jgi:hypothetical protein
LFEAYSIGISLRAVNLISPQLTLLMEQFAKLDALALTLGRSLGKLSIHSAGIRNLTTATNSANRAFERASVSAAKFRSHVEGVSAAGWGAAGAALGGGRIWRLAPGAGAVYGGMSLFESAKQLNSEQARFRLFGLSEAQNQEAFRYTQNLQVYGTNQIERLAAMREAQGVFRESGLKGSAALAGAKLAAPVLAKLDFLASSLDDESQARMHTANLSMLRYVESSGGLKSASEFNRITDFGYKLNVSSGGTVNWEQLRQFKARAGAAGFHLTDDAMARLEPVIAEMKGGAVGFGLSTGFNRLTGATRVPNQVAHELVDFGIWDKDSIEWNKMGGIKRFTTPGGPLSKDKIEMLSTNPELFYERYIKPMYDKMKLDAAEIARQNVMIGGTTQGRNWTLIDNQLPNIHKSIGAMKSVKGIDAATDEAAKSLSGEQKEFEAAWTDFKTNFGTTMLPFFSGILGTGAEILREMNTGTMPAANWLGEGANNFFHGGPYDPNKKTAKTGLDIGGLHIHSIINIDGKKVAEVVTKHQGAAASGPQTGVSFFDSTQALMPAGGLGF